MKSSIEIFAVLAGYLRQIPQSVIEQAQRENSWFSHIDVTIDAICSKLLDRRELEQWLAVYPIAQHEPKRVGIVMAGNIPAVGFADLLYVIASGDIPYIKYSSKDCVLMEYIVRSLKQIEPALTIEQYRSDAAIDAVIATGSDSAALHFRSLFGAIPALIRGSRHSVAVLSGSESSEDIEALSRDIFTHCGLSQCIADFCTKELRLLAPRAADATRLQQQLSPHPRTIYAARQEFYRLRWRADRREWG